jgi:hypothetical protein
MALPQLTDPDAAVQNTVSALPALKDPDAPVSTGNPSNVVGAPFADYPTHQIPSFMKKLDMINTGVDRGVKNFTLALMSKLPFGDTYQNAIKSVDAASTAEQNKNIKTYEGSYPQIGQTAGELLATAPFSPALGAVAKGASLLGEVAPTGLKTLAKYGSSALGGAGVLAGMDSQRYDPNNPGQLINTDAAKATLSSPSAYIAPMLGTKLATWMNASKALADAKDVLPTVMAENIKPDSASKTLSQMVFGVAPSLTGMGARASQLNNIGEPVSQFIAKMAGNPSAQNLTADKLTEYSANIMQSTLKKMGRAEDNLWDAGFKTAPIADQQGVKDAVANAQDMLTTNEIPGYKAVNTSLSNILRDNPNLNVNAVKQLNTIISGAAINARGIEGGIGNQLADNLGGVKDSLLNHIQNSLSSDDMKDFSAARAFSANKFQLFDNAPMLQKAIYDEASAHKLINSLTSEGGVLPPKRAALSILSPGGRDMVGATKVQQALEASDPEKTGAMNLDTFLSKTSPYTQTGDILNKDSYNSLQGLNTYLKSINQGSKQGWWKPTAIGAGLAGATGLGAALAGPVGAGAALASYGAASFVANHSPLKTIFNALTKNLPQSTYDNLTAAAERHLTRAGYIMSQDGVLQHKNEPTAPSSVAPQDGTQ